MESFESVAECLAWLGITIDEELRERAAKAMMSEPLRSQSGRVLALLEATSSRVAHVCLMGAFALAVWQHGYKAALESTLPEGDMG